MVLLVHLRVLSVRRLWITAAVTIGTVVRIAVWGGILGHAFRKAWTLRAVLRSSCVARGGWLIPNGRELRMLRSLPGDTDCLPHLSVDRSFGRTTLVSALLHISAVSLFVGFACSLFLLLLRLPLFADFLEFCNAKSVCYV